MKEKVCYVAADYAAEHAEAEASSAKDVPYELPDKSICNVPATVRMRCPELLFQPTLNGLSCKSLQDLTWGSIQTSDVDVRKDLTKNIILSGGTTMYEGLPERLKAEVASKAPAGIDVKVVATPERKFAVWTGGSTLASLSTFASSWVTKEDYEEHGAGVIHRKCT